MAQGLNIVEITDALEHYETPPGRMHLLKGIQNTTIIDDTYNASPIAVAEALRVLEQLKGRGRRIAVLGNMAELGAHSEEAHREAGKEAVPAVDVLITVGVFAHNIALAAREGGLSSVISFDTASLAGEHLVGMLRPNDIILIKGSQSIRLERAVERLMAEPDRKESLLVRQGKAWKER